MEPLHLTGGRLAAVVVGIPVLLAGIGYGGLSLTGVLARTSEHHQVSYAWRGGPISLNTGDGHVTVHSGRGSRLSVSYTEHYGLQRPSVRFATGPNNLSLQADCRGLLGGNCSVDFDITVPAGAALDLNAGDGSVVLVGVSGTIKVRTGDGAVRASGLRARVAQVSTGDGEVDLQWAVAPQHVTADTGDGSLSVSVPSGSGPYSISSDSGQGSSDIRVPSDPRAPRLLSLRSGDGSLSVRYSG